MEDGSWNYRVVRKDGMLGVHEVYWDNGEIVGITEYPEAPLGEDLEELKADLAYFALALKQPVLDYEETLATMDGEYWDNLLKEAKEFNAKGE